MAQEFANLYAHFKFKAVLEDAAITFLDRSINYGLMIVKNCELASRIMKKVNNASDLKFTWDISDHSETYMDLILFKGNRPKESGLIDVEVFLKPSNNLLYLPACNNHLASMK